MNRHDAERYGTYIVGAGLLLLGYAHLRGVIRRVAQQEGEAAVEWHEYNRHRNHYDDGGDADE
jgi:hypothetical protein